MRHSPPGYSGILATSPLRLAYRDWPGLVTAPPLVLLHGLGGRAADWERIAIRLARGRRVIAWDARGHGASAWAADAAYTSDAHFADVATALDALGITTCDLAGFSMGGGVAILCAGALPERVRRVVVIDAYPSPEMTPGSRQIAEVIAAYMPSGCGPPPFDPAIARAFADLLSEDDPRRLDLWPFWEAGTQPALIVRGAQSTVLTKALAVEMLHRRPSARLRTIAGVAHAIPIQRPLVLAAAIETFLESVTV